MTTKVRYERRIYKKLNKNCSRIKILAQFWINFFVSFFWLLYYTTIFIKSQTPFFCEYSVNKKWGIYIISIYVLKCKWGMVILNEEVVKDKWWKCWGVRGWGLCGCVVYVLHRVFRPFFIRASVYSPLSAVKAQKSIKKRRFFNIFSPYNNNYMVFF